MAINVTVTPQVQEVEVSATVQPYEVQVEVIDSPILELTTNGTSGDATFDPFTGVLNIPNYTTDLSGVVPNSRTLTINGTAYDLSQNRSWTVGDLLSSGSYANPIWITSLGWSKISGTPTSLSGYGILDPVVLTSGSYSNPSWITSLDWSKIANEPTTLSGYGITDAVPSSRTITINGTTLDLSADRSWTISAGIGGSIASGQVAFGSGVNTIGGSNNLFWDSANGRLGIGTSSPSVELQVIGRITSSLGMTASNFSTTFGIVGNGVDLAILSQANNTGFVRIMTTTGGTGTERARFFNNGNVGINTGSTDAGFRLDVNGTARVQGDFTISDTRNIILATGTGTKIGTSTSQKLSLWNATPDVQPTTAITASAFVANTSGIANDTATFDGYTIGQVVAALRRIGALA